MAKWLFLSFAAALLTAFVSDAIRLIGGEGVYFPLAPTDPSQFKDMFHPNGTLVERCMERKKMSNSIALFKHNTCFDDYDSSVKLQENSDPVKECGINRKFLVCIKTVMKELDSLCGWTETEATVYNYPLKAFEAGLDQACGDDAALYSRFFVDGGTKCITDAHEKMKFCHDNWSSKVTHLFDYSEEYCNDGWEFVFCMVDAYDYCQITEKMTYDIIRVVSKGLAATPCGRYYWKNEEDIVSEQDVVDDVESLPQTLPSLEDIQSNMEDDELAASTSEKKTDDGNTAATTRCTVSLVWTLMLYKLIAA